MNSTTASAEALRRQIVDTEEELRKLKEQLANIEAKDISKPLDNFSSGEDKDLGPATLGKWPLLSEEYKRYGRQMIVPNIGIQGQIPRASFN
jgi:adenylyltransferase/sulfurtransferase